MTPELAVKTLRASEQECWLKGWDKGAAVDYVYNLAYKWVAKALEKEPCEDAVSRANLLKKFEDRFIELQKAHQTDIQLGVNWCINTLKEEPPVIPTHSGWIPIVKREPTQEEKDDYFANNGEELCFVVENEMPLNGQEVLVSVGEFVSEDVFDEDFYNFEGMDLENVDAWMPKPTAYAKEMEKANGKN